MNCAKVMRFVLRTALIILAGGCKPPQGSTVDDIATANSLRTGFFAPYKKPEAQRQRQPKLSVAEIAKLAGIKNHEEWKDLMWVVVGPDDRDILMMMHNVGAMPVITVGKSGQLREWTKMGTRRGKEVEMSTLFVEHERGEEPKAWVSPDGKRSNMWVLQDVTTDAGYADPVLVNWVNLLDSRSAPLYRIGNEFIDTDTQNIVVSFDEIGNQVWVVRGNFDDGRVKGGSVFWSPNMRDFFSMNVTEGAVTVWKIQDHDSIDVVTTKPYAKVKVPQIVRRTLAAAAAQRQSSIPEVTFIRGLNPGLYNPAHIYLFPKTARPKAGVALVAEQNQGFGLAGDEGELTDRFYEVETASAGFALGQPTLGAPSSFPNATSSYDENSEQFVWTRAIDLARQGKINTNLKTRAAAYNEFGFEGSAATTTGGASWVNYNGQKYLAVVQDAPFSKPKDITSVKKLGVNGAPPTLSTQTVNGEYINAHLIPWDTKANGPATNAQGEPVAPIFGRFGSVTTAQAKSRSSGVAIPGSMTMAASGLTFEPQTIAQLEARKDELATARLPGGTYDQLNAEQKSNQRTGDRFAQHGDDLFKDYGSWNGIIKKNGNTTVEAGTSVGLKKAGLSDGMRNFAKNTVGDGFNYGYDKLTGNDPGTSEDMALDFGLNAFNGMSRDKLAGAPGLISKPLLAVQNEALGFYKDYGMPTSSEAALVDGGMLTLRAGHTFATNQAMEGAFSKGSAMTGVLTAGASTISGQLMTIGTYNQAEQAYLAQGKLLDSMRGIVIDNNMTNPTETQQNQAGLMDAMRATTADPLKDFAPVGPEGLQVPQGGVQINQDQSTSGLGSPFSPSGEIVDGYGNGYSTPPADEQSAAYEPEVDSSGSGGGGSTGAW